MYWNPSQPKWVHRFQSKTELLEHKTTVRLAALKNVGQEMVAVETISRSFMFMDVRGISPTNPRLLFQQHHRSSCASDCSDLQRPKLQLMGIFFHSDVGSNAKNIPKYPTTEVNPPKVKPLGFFIHWGLCQRVKDSPGSWLRSYPSPNPRNLVHMEPHGALEA